MQVKKSKRDVSDSVLNGSIEKALDVLACFASADSELGVSEVSRRLGLGVSTVHRLLNRMMAKGFVRQNPVTQRYGLGWRVVEIAAGMLRNDDITAVSLPYLTQLRDATGETARLHVLVGPVRVCLAQVESHSEIRAGGGVGKQYPLYSGAASKVILASMPEEQIAKVLRQLPVTPLGPNMITDPADMRRELKAVRSAGYAVSHSENSVDGTSVAAPVRDFTGAVVAALALTGPSSRLTADRCAELSRVVRDAAAQVSRRLGDGARPE